mgnify:CR=1 FL=1
MSDLYKQGIQLFKNGEYEQASEIFLTLLENQTGAIIKPGMHSEYA